MSHPTRSSLALIATLSLGGSFAACGGKAVLYEDRPSVEVGNMGAGGFGAYAATGGAATGGIVASGGAPNPPDPPGSLEWLVQFGSSEDDRVYAAASDDFGNVYVAGATLGALPGYAGKGTWNSFIEMFDADGVPVWWGQFDVPKDNEAYAVAVQKNGGAYMAGYKQSSIGNHEDAYVAYYDSLGNNLWEREFGSPEDDAVRGAWVHGTDEIYVVGRVGGELPGHASSGGADAFVSKLDFDGNELWTQQFGSFRDDEAVAVTTDPSGNVYVTGRMDEHPTEAASGVAFLYKFDAQGNSQWAHVVADLQVSLFGVGTDVEGNVFAAGRIADAYGLSDGYIRKADPLDSELMTFVFGTQDFTDEEFRAAGVWGDAYFAGHTTGAVPGFATAGGYDVFVYRYDSQGRETNWQFGSSLDEVTTGLSATRSGTFVVGYTEGVLPEQSSWGKADAFVAKLKP